MKLLRLTLHNFKGQRDFTLDTAGADELSVFGDNAAGKTTLADAWLWLLFGKDSAGAADFQVKTLDAQGEALHGLEHSVVATLLDDAGRERTLKKVLRELYQKKRGAADATFTGHTTDHFVDGVPVSKAEYDTRVAAVAFTEAAFRLLTDPLEFAERLHWKDRRRVLLDLTAAPSEADIIATNPALAPLNAALQGRTLEEHRRVVTARAAEVNRELERIPVRIEEAERSRPPQASGDRAALSAQLAALRRDRSLAEAARTTITSGGAVAECVARLREAEAAAQARKTELARLAGEASEVARRAQREAEGKLAAAVAARDSAQRAIQGFDADLEQLTQRMAERRSAWKQVDALTWSDSVETGCPTCGQPLPADKVATARATALAAFNSDKASRLEAISDEGRALKARSDALAEQRSAKLEEAAALEAEVRELKAAAEKLVAASAAAEKTLPPDPQLAKLTAAVAVLGAELSELQKNNQAGLAESAEAIARVDGQIRAAESAVAALDALERCEARLNELRLEERRLAAEYEELQRQKWLIEEFIRTRVSLVEGNINHLFRIARFQLFRTLVNGAIEECCEVMVGGVPYGSGLNHGARICAGLDIITTLQGHYKVAPPIFVDQCESITTLPPMACQVIRLVVSAGERALRVVTGPAGEANAFAQSLALDVTTHGDALRELVERIDGPEGVRADGSNPDTLEAHAALGDFAPEPTAGRGLFEEDGAAAPPRRATAKKKTVASKRR